METLGAKTKSPNQIIHERFVSLLSNVKIRADVLIDFVNTFTSIGMSKNDAKTFSNKVIELIQNGETLEETEMEMQQLFDKTIVREATFREKLVDAMRNREMIIVAQLEPYLKDICGKVIDYGAGSGKVAQGIHDALNLDVEGYDVSRFKHPSVSVPLKFFDGRNVPVKDRFFEAGVITNVLHHEEINEDIIRELTRVVSRKLVIIETIPLNDTFEARERCFATDAFWNRFFFNANVPVPGTYEMPEKWVERFENYGWKCVVSQPLGYDQPAVQDIHHLLVFEKKS